MMSSQCPNFVIGNNPERAVQIETLIELISKTDEALPSSVFIYGHSSTGKTFIITSVLQELGLMHVQFNCVESFSIKVLFESVLRKYSECSSGVVNGENEGLNSGSCDNMMEFVNSLKGLCHGDMKNEKFIIVLENSERIRDMDDHILPALLRLSEFTGLNICTILLSEVVWEKFHIKMGYHDPILIHFPQYTRDELMEILCQMHKSKYPLNFYRNYLNMFLSTFYRVTRNLVNIKSLAEKIFVEYCHPIETGDIKMDDVSSLWRWIVPRLKSALQFGYLNNSDQLNQSDSNPSALSTSLTSKILNLPFHSKMLLIAAYLASHNSPKSDAMIFSRHASRKKKRKVESRTAKTHVVNGPKQFSFDRLMAIFYSINDREKMNSSLLMSQVSFLVSIHLLDAFGDDMISEPKYICTANFDLVNNIARSIDFNVVKLLHS